MLVARVRVPWEIDGVFIYTLPCPLSFQPVSCVTVNLTTWYLTRVRPQLRQTSRVGGGVKRDYFYYFSKASLS